MDERAKTAAILKDAREWLSDPAHWCQGTLYWPSHAEAEVAEKTCLLGATYRVGGMKASTIRAHVVLSGASYDLYQRGAASVNDDLGYDAVMKVLELAISRS